MINDHKNDFYDHKNDFFIFHLKKKKNHKKINDFL